jgi:hemoglobin
MKCDNRPLHFLWPAKTDALLAPIFSGGFANGSHDGLYAYWESALLQSGRYRGVPFPKHADMPLMHQHFDRWLSISLHTVDELFEGSVADAAKVRAIKMSEVFRYKMELNNV